MDEWVDIVDEKDRVIGRATRRACHEDPSLIHRVVHVMVFNPEGDVLLQLRGENKKIQPGKWDTSVGGHLAAGEGYDEGARRELEEELGIEAAQELEPIYDYIWKSSIETERVRTYHLVHAGPFRAQPSEIGEARYWMPSDVERNLKRGIFTPNFEEEWARFKKWRESSRTI